MRPIGKQAIPDLQAGPARIVVRASRPVLYGLRQAESTATRDVQVRLEPPQRRRALDVSTTSTSAAASSSSIAPRLTDVESGVRVGNMEYTGYPAKGAGISSDPALRVAFFALLFDQDPTLGDPGLRARRGRQRGRRAARSSGVSEAVRQEPIEIDDAFLSASSRPSRSNSPNEKIPTDDRPGGLPEDQRRPAAEEQSVPDASSGEEDVRPSCCSRTRSSSWATRRSRRSSPTRAPTSIKARTSTSRSISASISP